MSKSNNLIFQGLHIVAWIIFIGLCIEAGALTVNFIVSMYNPGFVGNLYEKMDLTTLYNLNKWAFVGLYSFILAVAFLKAHLFYKVILLISKLNLAKPFNSNVAEQITNISYYTFSIGIISYIGSQVTKSMSHYGVDINSINQFWADSQAYILMAAVVYIIATIFSRGVEIQNENDLTV